MNDLLHGDCFGGAGGLAAGFRAQDLTTLFAIELDIPTARTYRANHGDVTLLRRDIRTVTASEVVRLLPLHGGLRRPLDVLSATFPCECFSLADPRGRRPDDPRRWLCLAAVRLATACDARILLCENVPQFQDDEAHARLLEALDDAGYVNRWEGVLDAADYSVPQARCRWFGLFSRDRSLSLRPPEPTSRGRPVTVREALAGLPPRAGSTDCGPDSSAYADMLRDRTLWRLDRNSDGVTHHVAPVHRDQFVERFSLVRPGSSVAEVFRSLDPAVLARLQSLGVMPQRPFEERQMRLHPARPAPTVLSSCTDQFIHPDVPRCLTLREVARLCGFPDGYTFHGNGFKQVGDCVPPPLALAWARTTREILGGGSEQPRPVPPEPPPPRVVVADRNFTFSDLCCGVGGIRIAAQKAGGRCVFSCDADEACRRSYEANFGETPHGDIFDIDPETVPAHDATCVGLPCTPYSKSGKGGGFRDGRANVFLGLLRFLEVRRPRVVLIENSDGLVSHDGGRTLRVMATCLRAQGYQVAWQVLDATAFGSAQHRSRIYIVGSRDGLFDFDRIPRQGSSRVADILEPDVSEGWLDPLEYTLLEKPVRKKSGMIFAGYLVGKRFRVPDGNPRHSRTHRQPNRIYSSEGVFATISAQEASGRHWVEIGGRVRKLRPLECSKLQGFPDGFRWTCPGQFYQQVGNSVYIPCVEEVARAIREQLLDEVSVLPSCRRTA